MNEELPSLRERLGRTGGAVVTIAAVVLLIAPIVSLFIAGSQVGDTIEWLPFLRTMFVAWLVISVVTILGVTAWLWLGWSSPGTDSMTEDEEPL